MPAAGMDDYISKPIRLEELAAALAPPRGRRWLPHSTWPCSRSCARPSARTTDRGHGRDASLPSARPLVATLRRPSSEDDAVELRRAAHTLKSNAATFGGAALAALCQELERIGEAGAVDGAADLSPARRPSTSASAPSSKRRRDDASERPAWSWSSTTTP